ncbi:hypothetical protein SAMN04487917_10738 [Arthrobacter sp. yr096]|uniref:hypothetical protein n=1 Tax=Arthrobacter sp. yr096 TaxID=1761750 RepID=UPI0008BC842A|nr:hypothetical protein [Arthrobacter sp. yr096]SEJ55368.1 hypothetical protein SAMN04487917_10738 [Arthrobacter sp. yr096]
MTSQAGGPASEKRAGHTRIARTALRKTVETMTARAFGVGGSNVTADLEDDSGKLGVRLSVQLALPPLLAPRKGAATVFDQAQAARAELVARSMELTGMELGRVDIRLTGAKPAQLKESQSKERRVQ